MHILFYSDLHATRFTLGLAELIWAIALLWPGDTFDRPTYLAMSHVMAEEGWGLVFALSAVTQFSILINGNFHDRFPVMFAAWNAVLWMFCCFSMYVSVYPPPAAISGEFALAMGAVWIWIRSGYVVTGRRTGDVH